MKSSLFPVLVLATSVSFFKASVQAAPAADFVFSVVPVGNVALNKPLLIEIKVVYKGKEPIGVYPLEKRFLIPPDSQLAFMAPKGWKLREVPVVFMAPGFESRPRKLVSAGSMQETIDLKDHFQVIPKGKAILPVTLKLWSAGEHSKLLVTLKTELKIQI